MWRATVRFLKREKILHPEALPSDAPSAPPQCEPAPLPEVTATAHIAGQAPPEPARGVTGLADFPDDLVVQPMSDDDKTRLQSIAPDGTPIKR